MAKNALKNGQKCPQNGQNGQICPNLFPEKYANMHPKPGIARSKKRNLNDTK